jgi:hypothetical protein
VNRNAEPGTLFAKPAKRPPITAPQILELLRVKHEGDVFVPECKTGPSQGHDHSRFDAWVMRKSWANAETIGYERWAKWLAAKESARSVGHNAGRALRERIDIEIYQEIGRAREAERKCEDMASRLGLYADIEAWLAETGLTWRLRGAKSASEFREIFEAKTGQSAAALARELGEASDRLARLAARFKEETAPSEPEPGS